MPIILYINEVIKYFLVVRVIRNTKRKLVLKMNTAITKLWNKNFIMFAIGKELSLGAKALLQFTLPLYILLETGNPMLMGTILATSALPSIFLTPIGGVIVDRFDKRKFLAVINFITAVTIIVYLGLMDVVGLISATFFLILVLFIFGNLVSITTKASVPILVPADALVKANSFTFLLANFSSIGIPILGGFVLARFGLNPILFISISCYLLATVINFLTHIPCTKQEMNSSLLVTIVNDLRDGIYFITKEKPEVGKVIFFVNMLFCVTLMPLMSIALPVLVTIYFESGEAMLGITRAIIVVGGIIGIILMGIGGKKAHITKVRLLLLAASLALIPTILAFMWSNDGMLTYIMLILTLFIINALSVMMSIICRSYFGEKSPQHMVGKVMALNSALVILGFSIGEYLYGFLFNRFITSPEVALLILVGLSGIIAFCAKIK